jgi:hypothetical protein
LRAPEARRRLEHRQEIAHARLGLEAQDLDVEDVDARIGKGARACRG